MTNVMTFGLLFHWDFSVCFLSESASDGSFSVAPENGYKVFTSHFVILAGCEVTSFRGVVTACDR